MSKTSWTHSTDAFIDERNMAEIERTVAELARDRCPKGACPIEPVLHSCVHESVSSIWRTSRITSYVPVLALKQVQDCIRAGTCSPSFLGPAGNDG